MNKKNICLEILFILSASLFGVFYKYFLTSETLNNYNSLVMSDFVTKSNVKPPYIKIFLEIIILLVILDIILVFILNKISKDKNMFIKISNYIPLIIGIILSAPLLYINKYISYFVIFVSLLVYLFIFIRKTNNKLIWVIFVLVTLLKIYGIYLISY